MQLFCDSDGVMYDFDSHAEEILGMDSREYEKIHGSTKYWAALNAGDPEFFLNLKLMPDAMELYEAIAHLNPIIISGSPSQMPIGHYHKQQAFRRDFGDKLPVITCASKLKSNFCKPGDHIIDDWPQHRSKWEAAGGIWVHHYNAVRTIEILRGSGILEKI